jgi:hypothetical protein
MLRNPFLMKISQEHSLVNSPRPKAKESSPIVQRNNVPKVKKIIGTFASEDDALSDYVPSPRKE